MLVENKFIFISLPRSASTAFKEACILHRFDIKHVDSYYDFIYENGMVYQNQNYWPIVTNDIVSEKIKKEKLEVPTNQFGKQGVITNPHERLIHLLNKFGYEYPIIAIKRNKYYRFISIFSKVLELLYQCKDTISYEILSKIECKELFCFDPKLILEEKYETIAQIVIDTLKLNKNNSPFLMKLLQLLFKPMSHWHNNNDEIIWFTLEDKESMVDLQNWVSDITKKNFTLHKSNEIKEPIVHAIKLNNEFRWVYDSYYLETERNQKKIKTIV